MNTKEIWKDAIGFKGLYEVSNLGHIRSVTRFVNHWRGGKRRVCGRNLKLITNRHGYSQVGIPINNMSKTFSVHRVVANAFILNPENKPFINHKNGIKTDNRVENLEWCTGSENNNHAYKTGLIKAARGENHGMSKLSNDNVYSIKSLLSEGKSFTAIAERFNVNRVTIASINSGKTWGHI